MNDNHPAPSAQPAAPQLPPEALNALIANQAREIDLREKELLTRQTEDKYSYEYAQTALKAQMQDNEKKPSVRYQKETRAVYFLRIGVISHRPFCRMGTPRGLRRIRQRPGKSSAGFCSWRRERIPIREKEKVS